MWLKRLLKQSNIGSGLGGGMGDGAGAGGTITFEGGQGSLFDEAPNREEVYNAKARRQKRKKLERKRKWRSLRDQQ